MKQETDTSFTFTPGLNCDGILAVPFDVYWAEAIATCDFAPRAEAVLPSFETATLEECQAWIEQHDLEAFDPPQLELLSGSAAVANMDREQLQAELEASGTAVYVDESTSLLREALVEQLHDEHGEEFLQELQEWCESTGLGMVEEQSPDTYFPAMDYAYPLPNFRGCERELARKVDLEASCITVMSLDGETVLALTGGGMDFSWEICHAYTVAGYRPPLQFAELPGMAGRGESDQDLKLIALCIESCEIAARWARGKAKRLAELKAACTISTEGATR